VDEEKVEVLASTPNNDFITARASIRLWENFFNTEFYVFERKQSRSGIPSLPHAWRSKFFSFDQTIIIVGMALRAMEYSLHSELADHVLCVFNVADVPFIQKTSRVEHSGPTAPELSRMAAASPSGGVTLPGYVTPALLNKVYHIDSNIGSAEVSQGVYETNNEWFSPADLAAFQSFMGLPNQPVATNIGGHSSDAVCRLHPDLCDEGNFDLQYLMGVSQVTPTTYYYINEVHFMLDWLTAMASSPSPPKVLSVSWGGNDHHFPVSQMTAVNHEAITLSAMGVTLIAGSGDDGANSYTRPVKCGYMTKFPASSPYFTAVGATNVIRHSFFISFIT
jgi:subtilase family serine protease